MQGYRFNTFTTEPANQAAYDCLHKVANLSYFGKSPILLRGPAGAGKTHLLWSIANHVRALEAPPGLAFITPTDFPDAVQRLAVEPGPITGDNPAILLVDNVERFVTQLDILEQVIRVFLDHNHCVVIACSENDLDSFPDPLRLLVHSGLVLPIQHRAIEQAPTMTGRLQDEVEQLRTERDRLEAELARKAPQLQSIAVLQERIARLEAENQTLQQQPNEDDAALEVLKAQHNQVTAAMKAEQTALEEKLTTLTTERDSLEARLAEGVSDEMATRDYETRIESLEHALQQAGRETAVAKEQKQLAETKFHNLEIELDALAGRLEAQAQADQKRLTEAQAASIAPEEHAALQEELAQQQALVHESKEQLKQHQSESAQLQQQLIHFESQIKALQANQVDQERLRALEFELEKSRKHISMLTNEMDSLRQDAASQVAMANMQAGEMERRLHEVQERVGLVKQAGRSGLEETRTLQAHTEKASQILSDLAKQLEAIESMQIQAPEALDYEADQATLFEAEAEVVEPEASTAHQNGNAAEPTTEDPKDAMAALVQDAINLEEGRG